MPIKDESEIARSVHDPGPDELSILLPHHAKLELHGTANGTFRIERHPDGSVTIRCNRNIHAWGDGSGEIRLDRDAWEVVQAFVAGGPGSSYISPFLESYFAEQDRKHRGATG